MVALIVALLIVSECLCVWGGLWLAVTLIRGGAPIAGIAVLLVMIPLAAYLGHRIFKAFERP